MASIRTGQRSVLAYLTDPFLGSFQTPFAGTLNPFHRFIT